MINPARKDIGRAVIYRSRWQRLRAAHGEEGVITSFTALYVFVRFGSDKHSKATYRGDLDWVTPRAIALAEKSDV